MSGPPANGESSAGLTSAEAAAGLARDGPNAVVGEHPRPLREFLRHLWAPIPWLLEATVAIQLFLHEYVEAAVIGGLLVLNAVISHLQRGRAQKALSLLRQQLHVEARVRRDGAWVTLPAEELVVGDVVHVRQGGVVPADLRLTEGSLRVDQSALTGESSSVELTAGATAYAASVVHGGDATGEVSATGARTFFGKTAELVRTAESANRQEREVVAVVRDLFVINAGMAVVVVGYAHYASLSLAEVVPLLLSILLASIPVALPATFTFASALGALELSRHGVLLTRLSALPDMASMTVLCTDKTGTLTRNEATVAAVWAFPGFAEGEVLRAAAMASDPSGQDPVDGAILRAHTDRGGTAGEGERMRFLPFDPATKRSEAVYLEAQASHRYVKGAPAVVAALGGAPDSAWGPPAGTMAERGERVLAVAVGDERSLRFVGLVGLADAVRDDSRSIVEAVHAAGIRVVMVTGDNAVTARRVAEQVGIVGAACLPEALHGDLDAVALECSLFAGVFPQDKIRLVRAFQRRGAVVGMSGDGVNDAPALRQAEAGLAMANATDVAKAAAAMVLTTPGLAGILPAIETSRRVFQRIITYTLAMLVKKVEMMALLVIGFLVTGRAPLTPLLMVLILFLNDFLTMSITTDRMECSPRPNRWNTRAILAASVTLAGFKLAFSLGIFLVGHYLLGMAARPLQTLAFVTLILSSQAGVYMLRERGSFWRTRPGGFLLASTALGLGVAALLATRGILMAPIMPTILLGVAGAGLVYFALVDLVKVHLFAALRLR